MKFKYILLFSLSLFFHIGALALINSWQRTPIEQKLNPVILKVSAAVEEEKVRRNPLNPKKLMPEKRPKQPQNKPSVAPVFGASKDSLANPAAGLSVPLGNTLMIEDDGRRVKDPGELKDLSRDAQLITGTVKIKYTESAIDAGIQGIAVADLLVDENGVVVEVNLQRQVGYGMDDSIKKAALASKFIPRLDRNGRAQMGWTQVKFILTLE